MDLQDRRIGLCLSSGFFGFFAHCGCIRALERLGVEPVAITGCSAGALTGALWASGLHVDNVRDVLLEIRLRDFFDPPGLRDLLRLPFGAISGRRMEEALEEVFPVQTFEECSIPLSVSVFDLMTGQVRDLDTGPLALAVRASTSLPGMFLPTPIDGHPCWDGGVAVKAPIRPLMARDDIDTILVCSLHRDVHRRPPRAILPALRLALDSLVYASDQAMVAAARASGLEVIVLSPTVPRSGPHRLHLGPQIIETAEREILRIIEVSDFGSQELS